MGERDRSRRWTRGSFLIDLNIRLPDGSSIECRSKKNANHSPEMIKHAAAIIALWVGLPIEVVEADFLRAKERG